MKDQTLRNLPRYNILHLKTHLKFPTSDSHEFIVKDISLGGLQVYSNTKVSLKSFNTVTLELGNKKFQLNIHQVWMEEDFVLDEKHQKILKEDASKFPFRSGFRIKFHELENYNQWKNLVHAFHNHLEK